MKYRHDEDLSKMTEKKTAVVGAGITGLSAAWQAKQLGIEIDLFDSKKRTGGVINTENEDGWRYELGPNTLLLKDPEIEALIDNLGLISRMETANSESSKRFIVKDDQLRALPQSLKGFFETQLFSNSAKARLLREPFARKTGADASIAEFFENRFGKEILDYAVNPFIAGIHAGKPEDLSVKYAFPALHDLEETSGSVILGGIRNMFKRKGQKKTKRRLISFETGLHEIPSKMSSELSNIYSEHRLQRTEKLGDGWYIYTNHGKYGPYSDVVITIPLHKWDDKMLPISNSNLEKIRNVTYPPLSMMVLGYKKEHVAHPLDGFGFLVPEVERRNILGALFTSTLFKNRAPEGHHLLTVFAGGARQPDIAQMESEKLLKLVEDDLKDLIGLTGSPVFKDHIYWPNSIPQYEKGYGEIYSILDELERGNPGLHLAGNFRHGISVPDCIKNGLKLGRKLADTASVSA